MESRVNSDAFHMIKSYKRSFVIDIETKNVNKVTDKYITIRPHFFKLLSLSSTLLLMRNTNIKRKNKDNKTIAITLREVVKSDIKTKEKINGLE